jgi:cob(I)alamin adenosyltransferase
MATRCAGMFYTGWAAIPGNDRFEASHIPAYCAAAMAATGESRMKTEGMTPEEINARHAEKMAKRKAARDKILATKTKEKGLLIVHTGKGKGKTTAAMGLAVRAVGNGMKVGIVQFVKGFTWDTQDRERDIAAAQKAWATAREMMGDETYQMVILDELNIVLRYDYIDLSEVVETLCDKRPGLHVVVTGRNAKEQLLEAADLVTEMTEIRHHFRDGVKAQLGIEF